MRISKTSLIRVSTFLLVASASADLFPVDTATDCGALAAGAACVGAGTLAGAWYGGYYAGLFCGAVASLGVADKIFAAKTAAWIEDVENPRDFLHSDDANAFRESLGARGDVWIDVMKTLCTFWEHSMNGFSESRIRQFLFSVVPVVILPGAVSPAVLARAKRISWIYALAQLLAEDDRREAVWFADAEVDYALRARLFSPDQWNRLRLMGEAYNAYKKSWGRASAALETLAQGDERLLDYFKVIFTRQLRSGPWIPQQHLD